MKMEKEIFNKYEFWLRNDLVFLRTFYTDNTCTSLANRKCNITHIDIRVFNNLFNYTNISKVHVLLYGLPISYEMMCMYHEFAYILYKVYNRKLILHLTKNQVAQLKKIDKEYPDFRDMDIFVFSVDKGFVIKNMNKGYIFTQYNRVFSFTEEVKNGSI